MLDRPLTREGWTARAASLAIEGRAFIDGAYVPALDRATFARLSPIDGKVFAHVADCGEADVDRAVKAARAAFESGVWSDADPLRKKTVLLRFAELIRDNLDELALLETLDVGKPIANALAVDVPSCANCIQYYAELADKLYDEVAPAWAARRRDGAQGAARRGRRDRALELPADHRRLEARAGARCRQLGGPEAGRAVSAAVACPRSARPRGRAA